MDLNRRLGFWAVALLVLGLSLPATAHNGAMAIAVPVQGIKVDGDLSDWPAGMRRYPIQVQVQGDQPKDAEDFQGSFRIGFNAQENVLYVGVEVQDQSTVLDLTNFADNFADGCEVYLESEHREAGALGAVWAIWGNSRKSLGLGRPEDAKVAVGRERGRSVYEWRLNQVRKTEGRELGQSTTVIGFDIVVPDKDADSSRSWMAWGPGVGKRSRPEWMGDVMLLGSDEPTGNLRGTVRWEDKAEGMALGKVRLQFLTSPSVWVQLTTDSSGRFAAEVPVGRYQVEAGYRDHKITGMEVAVGRTGGSVVPEVSFPRLPLGREVKAGRGRIVRASPRSRQGAWQTLVGSDGVLSAVRVVFQDHQGNLWLGGRQGVVRYDGQYLQNLTTQDGLANNVVNSIFQDREGYLWFGTDDGVSRYDGAQFKTFDSDDGLANNQVNSILQDREGDLWFATSWGVSRYDGQQFKNINEHLGFPSCWTGPSIQDRDGNRWFGTDMGVVRYDGKQLKILNTQDGLSNNTVISILQDREGVFWFGTDSGVSRYDGHQFKTFTTKEGLAANRVTSVLQDHEGYLWFGTWGGGVSRYDGKEFKTFTSKDGLAENWVNSGYLDREGSLWFGTWGGGVSWYDGQRIETFTDKEDPDQNLVYTVLHDRAGNMWFGTVGGVRRFDGQRFRNFTAKNGLPPLPASSSIQDREGNLWFGTWGGGASRYDGKQFRTFTSEDGLVNTEVHTISGDREGNLWFGTSAGASRYDGHEFESFTTQQGMARDAVDAILQDREGKMWFGHNTDGAVVSRFDGQQFKTFTSQDGLANAGVAAIFQDHEGYIWFGTNGAGVSRYDGKHFKTFTTEDGLGHNRINRIFQDRSGHLWFCTWGGGVSRYDGQVFQSLAHEDGLSANLVAAVDQDQAGNLWFGTSRGVTRFRPPPPSPPPVFIDAVVAGQRYEQTGEVDTPSTVDLVAFEFHGISFKTRPEAMIYRYRMTGLEENWNTTHERRVEYQDLPVGDYTFEVVAVNRDLEYSEQPAQVRLNVHPPYGIIALAGGLGLALVGLAFASGTAIRRRRAFLREQTARLKAQEALNRELEEELQTAHTLQMDLMPRESPQIPGFDLAGRCIPANHVGGDLFQYFQQEGRLSIALADVTGHAMEAAIPMVMFSGVLKSQLENNSPIEELFGRLNRSLHNAAGSRTFVCFAFGTIDTRTSTLRLSSAAFPYPYHFSAATGEIAELRVDAYPLGVRPDTRYAAIERQLAPGDYLVFCSDGIIEAADGTGAQFGYERTAASLRSGCAAGLSAEALLERVVAEVKEFRGETPQGDDQTVVVVKVETVGNLQRRM